MSRRDNAVDFTRGSIPKHLIKFTIPLFLGNLLQTFYNTVDTIWVGKFLGSNALAAVSVGFPIIFMLISLAIGITMATTVLVGQYKGAGDEAMLRKTINNSIILLAVAACIMTTLGILFHKNILQLMNTPEEISKVAAGYLNITFLGLIFTFGYNAIGAVLRGLGDSNTPLLFLFYTTVINIVLDPVLIFGLGPFPRMGVNGAALATVIAQAISCILAIRHLNRMDNSFTVKFQDIKYDANMIKQIISIGLPAGLQQTVVALGATVVMSIVNAFGETIIAAFGAVTKIDSFSYMPSMSIGLATSAIAAQNIGAGKYHRVREVTRWASMMSLIITGIVTAVVVSSPKILLKMFTDDASVLSEGAAILKILALYYVPFGFMWVFNGVIRGAGNTLVTMYISIFNLWIVRVPLAYYLSNYTALESKGIWIAMVSSSLVASLTSYIYFLTGRWRNSVIVSDNAKKNDTSEMTGIIEYEMQTQE